MTRKCSRNLNGRFVNRPYKSNKERFIYESNRYCEKNRCLCYNNTKVRKSLINTGHSVDFFKKNFLQKIAYFDQYIAKAR